VVGVETVGRLALCTLDLGLLQVRCDFAHDACRDLILQIENVLQPAVKTLCPEMYPRCGIDELRCYANAIPTTWAWVRRGRITSIYRHIAAIAAALARPALVLRGSGPNPRLDAGLSSPRRRARRWHRRCGPHPTAGRETTRDRKEGDGSMTTMRF